MRKFGWRVRKIPEDLRSIKRASAAELLSRFENRQASGGNLWLGQDGGRVQTEPISGTGVAAGLGLLRGGDLQPAADGSVRGGLKRPARAERAAIRGSSGRSSAPVETAVIDVLLLYFINFTHEKMWG